MGSPWSQEELSWHINLKELTAVLFTLKALCSDINCTHVHVKSDNTTTVSYINKKGGKKASLNTTARDIWFWAISREIWLSASHLPGSQNVEADRLSRTQYKTETEWQLDPHVFRVLNTTVGPFDIDLFASRLNHQCDKYVSWLPDPIAFAIDAFQISWYDTKMYAPSIQCHRCSSTETGDGGGDLFLVAPLWTTQPWFSKALHMSWQSPRLLPQDPQLLRLPQRPSEIHPLWKRLHLTLFSLSSDPLRARVFRRTQCKSFCKHGETPPKVNTAHISKNGCFFVMENALIHCIHL